MAETRRRLRSSTVVLGGMGVLAATLSACGSDPDRRCVDRDSYDYINGYKIVADKNCKSGSSSRRPTARAAREEQRQPAPASRHERRLVLRRRRQRRLGRRRHLQPQRGGATGGGFGCSGVPHGPSSQRRPTRGRHAEPLERHTIEPRPGWQQTVEEQGLDLPAHPLPRRLPAPLLGRERVLRLHAPRDRGAGGGRRGTPPHVPGGGRAHRRPRTASPTSASPTRASSRRSPRPGAAAPNSRPSTAASTSATTAPARPSCWSTTPTPPPRWSRPPPPVVLDGGTLPRAPTSGTPSTNA